MNPAFVPNAALIDAIDSLALGHVLVKGDEIIAGKTSEQFPPNDINLYTVVEFKGELIHLRAVTDLFINNAIVLVQDFDRITANRESAPISASNKVISPENIFIYTGAIVECSILKACSGPIYIGKNAEVMEGSMLRGGIALCENAVIKMGAKIYSGTTIGPYCKAGGSSIMF